MGDFEDPEVIDTSSFNNELKFLGMPRDETTHVSNLLTRVGSSSLGVSNSTRLNIKRQIEKKLGQTRPF